ncbi:hypothetical protein HGA91_05835 [candidate division WWE3 bacterium]|nr:hypothetical protein [candidate division WWE3 bacterium]
MDRQVHPLLERFRNGNGRRGRSPSTITVTTAQLRSILRIHGTPDQRRVARGEFRYGTFHVNIGGTIVNVVVRNTTSRSSDPNDSGNPIAAYGIYFPSAATRSKKADEIYQGLRAFAEPLPTIMVGPWLRTDEYFFEAAEAFGITKFPAFVMVRAWLISGDKQPSVKKLLHRIKHTSLTESYVLIDDPVYFDDVQRLIGQIEQLSLIFSQADPDQFRRAVNRFRSRHQISKLFLNIGSRLGKMSVTFGFGKLGLKIQYADGKVESAELTEKSDSDNSKKSESAD